MLIRWKRHRQPRTKRCEEAEREWGGEESVRWGFLKSRERLGVVDLAERRS